MGLLHVGYPTGWKRWLSECGHSYEWATSPLFPELGFTGEYGYNMMEPRFVPAEIIEWQNFLWGSHFWGTYPTTNEGSPVFTEMDKAWYKPDGNGQL